MEFLEIAGTNDIPEGAMKTFKIQEKNVLVARIGINYFAIEGNCPHMQGDLSKGNLNGTIVTCPLHGSQFDVTTGKCIRGPKIGFIKLKTRDIVTFPIKTEEAKIFIGI